MNIEEADKESVKIIPNPNNGQFQVFCNNCPKQVVRIKNTLGQVIWKGQTSENGVQIQLNAPNGIYSISLSGLHKEWVVIQ